MAQQERSGKNLLKATLTRLKETLTKRGYDKTETMLLLLPLMKFWMKPQQRITKISFNCNLKPNSSSSKTHN